MVVFGHRDTLQTEELKEKVRKTVEYLIVEEGVGAFLFGSRSKFDELCHIVVTELKEKYPHIQRIAYLCKHESGCLVGAGMSLTRKIKDVTGRDEYVAEHEEIKKSDRINSAGRACYVERNQWMIESSNFVVIRYKHIQTKQKKCGTDCALQYAKKLQKNIIFIVVNGD